MPLASRNSVTAQEWITILTWREKNMRTPDNEVVLHFGQPENGSLHFAPAALRRQWKQWKDLKKSRANVLQQESQSTSGTKAQRVSDAEWLQVFAYMDKHPTYTKEKVARHFTENGLKINRRFLPTKCGEREEIEERVATAAAIRRAWAEELPGVDTTATQRERCDSNTASTSDIQMQTAVSSAPSDDMLVDGAHSCLHSIAAGAAAQEILLAGNFSALPRPMEEDQKGPVLSEAVLAVAQVAPPDDIEMRAATASDAPKATQWLSSDASMQTYEKLCLAGPDDQLTQLMEQSVKRMSHSDASESAFSYNEPANVTQSRISPSFFPPAQSSNYCNIDLDTPYFTGSSITTADWLRILTWREENSKTERDVLHHFAQPENGSLQVTLSALRCWWKQWKELKKAFVYGQQSTFDQVSGTRALDDYEWVQVFRLLDERPDYSRDMVVSHFASHGLIFTQEMLSRHIQQRGAIEGRVVISSAILQAWRQAQSLSGRTEAEAQIFQNTTKFYRVRWPDASPPSGRATKTYATFFEEAFSPLPTTTGSSLRPAQTTKPGEMGPIYGEETKQFQQKVEPVVRPRFDSTASECSSSHSSDTDQPPVHHASSRISEFEELLRRSQLWKAWIP